MAKIVTKHEAIYEQYEQKLQNYQQIEANLMEQVATLKAAYSDAATKAYIAYYREAMFLEEHPQHFGSVLMRKWTSIFKRTRTEEMDSAVRNFLYRELRHPKVLAGKVRTDKVDLDVLPNPVAFIPELNSLRKKGAERVRWKLF